MVFKMSVSKSVRTLEPSFFKRKNEFLRGVRESQREREETDCVITSRKVGKV
jgi:hypothetical protein